jgi:thiol:disulfide interchange protein DsbD
VIGGSLLFTYALGMGVLFFVIAAFAVSLPKSGAWMDAVKSFFGVVMIVAALYFLRNVSPALASYGARTMRWLSIHVGLLFFGLLIGGLHLSFKYSPGHHKLRKALGVGAITVGAFGMLGFLLTAEHTLSWVHGEEEGRRIALSSHKPALYDFYADWCLPCKELELKTFADPRVKAALADFTLVKVNCTEDDNPAVIEAKKRHHADTLPTLSLLDADGKQVNTINHFVSPEELIAALRSL